MALGGARWLRWSDRYGDGSAAAVVAARVTSPVTRCLSPSQPAVAESSHLALCDGTALTFCRLQPASGGVPRPRRRLSLICRDGGQTVAERCKSTHVSSVVESVLCLRRPVQILQTALWKTHQDSDSARTGCAWRGIDDSTRVSTKTADQFAARSRRSRLSVCERYADRLRVALCC